MPGNKAALVGALLRPFAGSRPTAVSLRHYATPAAEPNPGYDRLCELCKDIHEVNSVGFLVNWEDRVMMPVKGAESRGRHKAALTSIVQEKVTSRKFSDTLEEARENWANLNEYERSNVRDADRVFMRYNNVDPSLEREIAEYSAEARMGWMQAREENDYKVFKRHLEKLVKLVKLHKERAKMISPDQDPFDTAIDMFERGMTTARLQDIFDPLEKPLKTIIDKALGIKETCERQVNPA